MDTTPRAGKRGRSDSLSSCSSTSTTNSKASSSRSLSPVNKILRPTTTPGQVIECNLPPTCLPTSQTFDTTAELERHQLAFHTYICRTPVRDRTAMAVGEGGPSNSSAVPMEFKSRQRNEWKECRKIFPDQRILDLVSPNPHPVLPLSWLFIVVGWQRCQISSGFLTDSVASSRDPRSEQT
jgi:hypothetical protein